jgi:hypothetical protein
LLFSAVRADNPEFEINQSYRIDDRLCVLDSVYLLKLKSWSCQWPFRDFSHGFDFSFRFLHCSSLIALPRRGSFLDIISCWNTEHFEPRSFTRRVEHSSLRSINRLELQNCVFQVLNSACALDTLRIPFWKERLWLSSRSCIEGQPWLTFCKMKMEKYFAALPLCHPLGSSRPSICFNSIDAYCDQTDVQWW